MALKEFTSPVKKVLKGSCNGVLLGIRKVCAFSLNQQSLAVRDAFIAAYTVLVLITDKVEIGMQTIFLSVFGCLIPGKRYFLG